MRSILTLAGAKCGVLSFCLLVIPGEAAAAIPQRQTRSEVAAAKPAPCESSATRIAHSTSGTLNRGERFEQRLRDFVLRLTPVRELGWRIEVLEPGREDDLSSYAIPLRGTNSRQLYAFHLRNPENTGPNDGRTNAPGTQRFFHFSPEVGRTLFPYKDPDDKFFENLEKVEAFGQGELDLTDFRLTPPGERTLASFLWIKFSACLSWPRPAGR